MYEDWKFNVKIFRYGKKSYNKKTDDSVDVTPYLGFFKKEVYTDNDLRVLFGCSDKLIRDYRTNGYLGYTKIGSKFYYSPMDIINFLMLNHHEPYRKDIVS